MGGERERDAGRERENMKLGGREMSRIWERTGVGRKNMNRMYYMKNFKIYN